MITEATWTSRLRSSLRSFHPIGIVAIAMIGLAGNMVGAILALLWARVTLTPWRELGFVRPRHGNVDLFLALVGGVAY